MLYEVITKLNYFAGNNDSLRNIALAGQTPSEIYRDTLVSKFGNPYYRRIDGPITNEQKTILSQTAPDSIKATSLAGLSIVNIQTKATGNRNNFV